MWKTEEDAVDALCKALENKRWSVVRKIREIMPEEVDGAMRDCLQEAVEDGDAKQCRLLLKHGAPKDPDLLLLAAEWVYEEVCKVLLDAGIDPNAKTGIGATVLASAVNSGSVELVRLLVGRGADVNLPCDAEGKTPLHEAMGLDDELSVDMCRTLIELGADLTLVCDRIREMTPFQVAVHEENLALVTFFVEECGEDPAGTRLDGTPVVDLAERDSEVRTYLLAARTEREIRKGVESVAGASAEEKPRAMRQAVGMVL